jgi:hypothetical protein
MMKKQVICISLLAFLSFVSNPHTAAGMGTSTYSSETVGIISLVTLVVLGIPYLMKKHKERSQKKEQKDEQNHETSFNVEERIATNGETVIWCW